MSERKHTFHSLVFIETEQYGDIYYKNDVDLVIAERDKVIETQDKEIEELKKERNWLAKDRSLAYRDLEKRAQTNIMQDKIISRQKRKLCLALAKACFCHAFALKLQGHGRSTDLLKRHNRAIERKYKRLELRTSIAYDK